MLHLFLHALSEVGPAIIMIVGCVVYIVAALVLYIGIAMWATLHSGDTRQQDVSYWIFRDLLNLVRAIVCELVKLFRAQEHK